MSRLYACIVSTELKRDKEALQAIAHKFSYSIEMIDDGILFDVSGLERLVGKPAQISQKILEELQRKNIPGSIAVAETIETASLLAQQNRGTRSTVHSPDTFQQLPLTDLPIEQDVLNIFNELGISRIEDLLAIPEDELVNRYGRNFRDVIDVINQKGRQRLTPNLKDCQVTWSYHLDLPVEDFEQLIFLLNHGLEKMFGEIARDGFSTEHLHIAFKLTNKTKKTYEIKTSFPTLERAFWLKLINLRISLDPPDANIIAVDVVSYFTKPRPAQKGLYAVTRPEPERLLLTVNKLKKMVGEENVGVPVILNQRLAEAFGLDADAMPQGREPIEIKQEKAVIAFSYFRPPVRAEVLVREGRLVFVKTCRFEGYVSEYSGVWKANSKWWNDAWRTQEWDVEIENKGIYRLCKVGKEWYLAGEYD
jgi:protein ImuB